MKKLPKVFKAKWLEALRSGKYKQGVDRLETDNNDINKPNTYCCLGVACKMLYPKKDITGDIIEIHTKYSKIPKLLRGDEINNDIVSTLTRKNDGRADFIHNQQSFKKIANWIEKNL